MVARVQARSIGSLGLDYFLSVSLAHLLDETMTHLENSDAIDSQGYRSPVATQPEGHQKKQLFELCGTL